MKILWWKSKSYLELELELEKAMVKALKRINEDISFKLKKARADYWMQEQELNALKKQNAILRLEGITTFPDKKYIWVKIKNDGSMIVINTNETKNKEQKT